MSLATRCPACGTIFRVVQDQLKVSEGWVRCGQCHEVFHGIEALFDLDSDPAVAARRAASRGTPPSTRAFAEERASAPIPLPAAAPALPPAPEPASSAIAIPTPAAVPTPVPPALAPSPFGAPGRPPAVASTRPGYTGFTPAASAVPPPPERPAPPAPTSSSFAPVSTRGTIAPRFAARLAEEAARAQWPAPGAIPPADPPDSEPLPPAPVSPFGSALQMPRVAGWQPSPSPIPAPAQAPAALPEPAPAPSFAAAPSFAPAPVAATVMEPSSAPLPVPVPVHMHAPEPQPFGGVDSPLAEPAQALVSEPAPSPTPAPPPAYIPPSLLARPAAAAAEAVSATAPAADPAPAFAVLREPSRDVGGSTMPSLLADDAADDDDEAQAGPLTLASMLPEDGGDWPPRRRRKKATDAASSGTELALVDRTKDPRFLREARSGARWRKPWVRAALSVTLLLLVVAAVGQVAWPQRDTLAARWPATLPAWQWLCQQAGCRIEAPRAIASLALDGSSLTRTDTEHVLLFAADLHNRADHPVRMPSFDVTFMDLNGEIVSRKVLTPEQLGIHQDALPPEGELHVHARLQVGTLAASGFQADLFYP